MLANIVYTSEPRPMRPAGHLSARLAPMSSPLTSWGRRGGHSSSPCGFLGTRDGVVVLSGPGQSYSHVQSSLIWGKEGWQLSSGRVLGSDLSSRLVRVSSSSSPGARNSLKLKCRETESLTNQTRGEGVVNDVSTKHERYK